MPTIQDVYDFIASTRSHLELFGSTPRFVTTYKEKLALLGARIQNDHTGSDPKNLPRETQLSAPAAKLFDELKQYVLHQIHS